ncbi:site-specific integrase [uncultured Chryseobacterium sp.]|uniref:site-specific integrase n=1 Tax=uncultured Chryseobacterium sp. TaxID=259322 RepID=UPI0026116DCE|nr:site-specific integrase [uncultured Chryseobacterium sp.]
MITIRRKINIELEKRKKDGQIIDDNVPIFFRLTYNANRINLFTGYRIDRNLWNEQLLEVKKGSINKNGISAEEINTKIQTLLSDLQTFFIKCQIEDRIPEPSELKNYFNDLKDKGEKRKSKLLNAAEEESKTFFDVYDEFTSYSGKINNWSEDTFKKFAALKNHLTEFNKDLSFEDLDSDGMTKLMSYFFGTIKLNNVTTKKYLKNLKWFLRFAIKHEYVDGSIFKEFNPKLKTAEKPIVFLSEEEIKKIRDLEIPETKQYLERVRDILLFTCFCGLRHSDVAKLKKSDIKNDKIQIVTKKTTDNLTIELNNIALHILKKYNDYEPESDFALPVISNQKYNDYLKELGALAKINDPISHTYFIGNKRHDDVKPKSECFSSHLGRRTFICLCVAKGIPIQVIMKWTGHSDYQSMKPYIDVVDSTREAQMQKLNIL